MAAVLKRDACFLISLWWGQSNVTKSQNIYRSVQKKKTPLLSVCSKSPFTVTCKSSAVMSPTLQSHKRHFFVQILFWLKVQNVNIALARVFRPLWHLNFSSGGTADWSRQILHKSPDAEGSGPQTGSSGRTLLQKVTNRKCEGIHAVMFRHKRSQFQTGSGVLSGNLRRTFVSLNAVCFIQCLCALASECQRSKGRSQECSWSQQANSSRTKLNLCTLTMKRLWEMLGGEITGLCTADRLSPHFLILFITRFKQDFF